MEGINLKPRYLNDIVKLLKNTLFCDYSLNKYLLSILLEKVKVNRNIKYIIQLKVFNNTTTLLLIM